MTQQGDENAEPGSRSGEGVRSLWTHLGTDASRKASIGKARSATGQLGSPSNQQVSARGQYTLLVVDDIEAARYAVVRSLRHDGFLTREASDGETALKLAEFVDAVVLDVQLPDVSGLEVCRMLRARPKTAKLPVVLVSAVFVEPADQSAALAIGADAYFVPPVDPQALASTLDALLLRE